MKKAIPSLFAGLLFASNCFAQQPISVLDTLTVESIRLEIRSENTDLQSIFYSHIDTNAAFYERIVNNCIPCYLKVVDRQKAMIIEGLYFARCFNPDPNAPTVEIEDGVLLALKKAPCFHKEWIYHPLIGPKVERKFLFGEERP